ncbi:hypothetical protein PGB90_007477 [Kerria lacca]
MGFTKCLYLVFIIITFECAKLFNAEFHDVGDTKLKENVTECPKPEPSIDEFPSDPFTQEQRIHGAIIVHLIVGFYCFVFIAFVCNDYFLPSVFCICQDLHLSHDVAGATFMATATCAPELFVNIIGTYLTKSDLGIGTVVGSAVCNILGVTACAGLAASKNIKLELWPMLRDSGIYISAVTILAVILADGVVDWSEALILVILYFLYFVLMFTQKKMKTVAKKILTSKNSFSSTSSMDPITNTASTDACYGTYRPFYFSDYIPHAEKPTTQNNEKIKEKSLNEEIEPICSPPGGFLLNIWWFISVPVSAVLSISIPDCRVYRKFYPLTFIVCVVWIGISSYVVSWMMTIFGYTYGINDAVMGITFLAIGGSIPEASSAVVNARHGVGSMTVSNALGANTLDILIGLGGPWLFKTLLPRELGGGPIVLETSGLTFNCVCLIVSVILLNTITSMNSFNMNRLYGVFCLIFYFVFIILLILTDMNIIFTFGKSICS